MALLDLLKRVFSRGEVPDETRKLFQTARSTQDLLRGLDDMLTTNEVQFREIDGEINKLEALEGAEIGKIKAGAITGRQKRNALLYVKRLRRQMDAYEKRLRIYDRNMNLHLSLISKIQDMEAMKLAGVDEKKIDAIILKFEESLDKHNETMHAGSVLAGTNLSAASAEEERELRALESEILGVGEAAAEAEAAIAELEVKVERPRRERPLPRSSATDLERLVAEGPSAEERAEANKELDEIERQLLEE